MNNEAETRAKEKAVELVKEITVYATKAAMGILIKEDIDGLERKLLMIFYSTEALKEEVARLNKENAEQKESIEWLKVSNQNIIDLNDRLIALAQGNVG